MNSCLTQFSHNDSCTLYQYCTHYHQTVLRFLQFLLTVIVLNGMQNSNQRGVVFSINYFCNSVAPINCTMLVMCNVLQWRRQQRHLASVRRRRRRQCWVLDSLSNRSRFTMCCARDRLPFVVVLLTRCRWTSSASDSGCHQLNTSQSKVSSSSRHFAPMYRFAALSLLSFVGSY